jgi:hypothetical protein
VRRIRDEREAFFRSRVRRIRLGHSGHRILTHEPPLAELQASVAASQQ